MKIGFNPFLLMAVAAMFGYTIWQNQKTIKAIKRIKKYEVAINIENIKAKRGSTVIIDVDDRMMPKIEEDNTPDTLGINTEKYLEGIKRSIPWAKMVVDSSVIIDSVPKEREIYEFERFVYDSLPYYNRYKISGDTLTIKLLDTMTFNRLASQFESDTFKIDSITVGRTIKFHNKE